MCGVQLKTNQRYSLTEGIVLKKLLLTLLPLFSLLQAADFPLAMSEDHVAERKAAFIMNVLAPKECGDIKLNRYEEGFSLSINDQEQEIPNYMVSKPLRQMPPKHLAAFLQSNYLTIKQCSDGEFSLQEHGRIRGGGPFSAAAGGLAGKWVGQAAVLVAGYTVLLGATGVVTVVAGREAGGEFFKKVQEQSIPHLWEVSETISNVTGAGGAIIGIFVPGA